MKALPSMFAALIVLAMPSIAAVPDAGPIPPCGAEAWPVFATPASSPAIATWRAADLAKTGWKPPACTGWLPSSRSKLVVALAGSFRLAGNTDSLLTRAGSISGLQQVRYWSTSDKAWRPLALDAAALSSADPKARRQDFSANELMASGPFYYWMNDSRSSSVVYRMLVLEREPQRLVLASENASPVRALFVTLFEPGVLQTVEIFQRRGADVWEYYLLTRVDQRASIFADGHEASYINRAIARYRHLVGIPTDREPPAAR